MGRPEPSCQGRPQVRSLVTRTTSCPTPPLLPVGAYNLGTRKMISISGKPPQSAQESPVPGLIRCFVWRTKGQRPWSPGCPAPTGPWGHTYTQPGSCTIPRGLRVMGMLQGPCLPTAFFYIFLLHISLIFIVVFFYSVFYS